jgi:hypothetical protein
MPLITRVFLRTSLLMLVAGIGIGAAGLAEPAWMTHERSVSHTHLLLVGWLINMVIGVAWWMFPRAPGTVAPPAVGVRRLGGAERRAAAKGDSGPPGRRHRDRAGGAALDLGGAPARGHRAAGRAAVAASARALHATSPAGRFLIRYSPIAPR